ncbi:hypothetical protein C0993_011150 [Termitomyces sp. T159_Od127]|nr:hypothetical protein C0993_011150 [Termitomyces sp. T159_Od127]
MFQMAPRPGSVTSDPTVEKTYHYAVLVRRVRVVVEKAWEAEARGEAVSISKKSLALPTHQRDEERRSGKGKQKASLPLPPMNKGKKRARVVSPVAVTPEVESEEDDKDKARHLSAAIETSKAAPGVEDLAEMEQDEAEEGAKVGLEATP